MDPVEEVAYRNRPPLLEDVSIQGPLRIPIKDAMQTLEEREAIEADFRWYRWSKFAAPWLFFCLLLAAAMFSLTAWTQLGNYKKFNYYTVYNTKRPWGVPRKIVKRVETSSTLEAGMPKYLRNLRIACVFTGFFAIVAVFLTLLVKPRPRIRKALNYFWVFFLFCTFCMGVVEFAIALSKYKDAKRCPWNQDNTHEKCTVRRGVAIIAIALDAGIFVGSIISAVLLAWYNGTGDWKLLRTGWRERERDAETEVVRHTEGADKFLRKVRPVRITILSFALLFTLGCVIVLTIFIVILHMDYTHDYQLEKYRDGYRGKDMNEQPGWSARNTRLRFSASIITILSVLLSCIPTSHRVIAYLFACLYLIACLLSYVIFGLDIHEMQRAHDMTCPLDARCRDDIYVAIAIIDFFLATALLFYVLYEYIAKGFTTSRWSGRNYCPHEIYKHDTKLDSMRPVRCELTGHVMTAKEYVYRYRFVAGTGSYAEPYAPQVYQYQPAPIAYGVAPQILPPVVL